MTYTRDKMGNIKYSGLIFALLDAIAVKLNFTYEVREPADGLWGTKVGGEWSGMMRQVVDKDVFLAAASFAVSSERSKDVDFTAAIDFQPYGFMYRRPEEITRATIFIKPFSPFVWLCLFISLILVGPIFWVVHTSTPAYEYMNAVNDFGFFKLQYCFFFCYSSLLQQGCPTVPVVDSGRIYAGFWLLFTIIMTVSYLGNIFAFLYSPQIEFPINTLDQVMTRSHSWGVLGGSVIENYLQVKEAYLLSVHCHSTP